MVSQTKSRKPPTRNILPLLLVAGINGVINFGATLLAFYLMDRVGRKTLLIVGATLMAASLGLLAALGWQYSVGACSKKKRAVMFFGWVVFLISVRGQAPHVLRAHTGHTCGEPDEIEMTAVHGLFTALLMMKVRGTA